MSPSFCQDKLSPKQSVHGVLLEVLGVGVLLLGKSGIGKSEAALDMLVRGYRLVADDVVDMRRLGPNLLRGGRGIIRHHMEIRGLGIINIKDLFGIGSVLEQHKFTLSSSCASGATMTSTTDWASTKKTILCSVRSSPSCTFLCARVAT